MKRNEGKSFQGSIVLGKGLVLEPQVANTLISKDPRNKEVLFHYLNGDDLNNNPDQSPSRWVINFFDWVEEKARQYPDCFEIVERLVKPERIKMKGDRSAEYWWQFLRSRKELYRAISEVEKVFTVALTTNYLNIAYVPSCYVFSHLNGVYALEKWHFVFLQSNSHLEWSWKISSSLESRLRYTPSDCFETFPFPHDLTNEQKLQLGQIGETYHELRHQLMLKMQLGLTKTYNAFHAKEVQSGITTGALQGLDKKAIEKRFGKEVWNLWNHLQKSQETCTIEVAIAGIIQLRQLHVKMDNAVLEAYGWAFDSAQAPIDSGKAPAVKLRHDFYEVENDRVRYTIHPDARKEILKRLLELNHRIHEEEVKAGL